MITKLLAFTAAGTLFAGAITSELPQRIADKTAENLTTALDAVIEAAADPATYLRREATLSSVLVPSETAAMAAFPIEGKWSFRYE